MLHTASPYNSETRHGLSIRCLLRSSCIQPVGFSVVLLMYLAACVGRGGVVLMLYIIGYGQLEINVPSMCVRTRSQRVWYVHSFRQLSCLVLGALQPARQRLGAWKIVKKRKEISTTILWFCEIYCYCCAGWRSPEAPARPLYMYVVGYAMKIAGDPPPSKNNITRTTTKKAPTQLVTCKFNGAAFP